MFNMFKGANFDKIAKVASVGSLVAGAAGFIFDAVNSENERRENQKMIEAEVKKQVARELNKRAKNT